MNRIPFKKINTECARKEVDKLLKSGQIGLGNKVFELENMLAEYFGCKYVIAVDSCTSALFLSLKYDNAEEVGVPSMTVPLVADAVLEAGKKLYFTDETDWVGSSYRLEGTNVIDSAHQLERNQLKEMNNKDKVCFSFYPTKNIGSADGGAIATNDKKFADWARSISNYGREGAGKHKNSWEYDIKIVGYKRHYTNLQSVICIEQLKQLDKINKRRQEIVDKYNQEFWRNNKSLYLYRLDVSDRDKFVKYMADNGIECGVHFKPLHLMKAFRDIETRGDMFGVDLAYERTVSLPLYNKLTDKEVSYIIKKILEF